MLDILKELILDYLDIQEFRPETGVRRRLEIATVPGKATICMGVRRCGKSTFMYQLMKKLMDDGVSPKNILYVNFFDDRLHDLQHTGLGGIMDAYFSVYPEKKYAEKIYCFFDEIQAVPKWESFVDRLIRTENCEVYITGSSANLLSREIATQMRGRALSWEMFPFSFREYLDFKNIEPTKDLSTKTRMHLLNAFDEYWESGGFPEIAVGMGVRTHDDAATAALHRNLRVKTHQEYFNAMLFRDLVERYDITHPKALVDLAHWLVDHTAAHYTINSLTGYLKSLGHKAPKATVSEYLEWFEDAYFLFTLRIYDASLARVHSNPKKIYCIDHAMARSISSGILLNSGHLLENLVFMALRRVVPTIYYFRTRSGKGVDFVVVSRDRSKNLVQVCESLLDLQTRKREVTALTEAMDELDLNSAVIVTRNETERIKTDSGMIEVIPAWQFLLNVDDRVLNRYRQPRQ